MASINASFANFSFFAVFKNLSTNHKVCSSFLVCLNILEKASKSSLLKERSPRSILNQCDLVKSHIL
jgi:hypothetical protein